MHLWRMFSKKDFEGKGWLMRQKEELIWDRRGAEREHETRSTYGALNEHNGLSGAYSCVLASP